MTMQTIYEVFQRYLPVYLKSSKNDKQAILNVVCNVTSGYFLININNKKNILTRKTWFAFAQLFQKIIYHLHEPWQNPSLNITPK